MAKTGKTGRTRRAPRRMMGKAKAKRMVTNVRKAKAKRNMDTFFLKARYTGNIVPVQGSLVSNYVYFNPSLVNATDGTAITNNSEFKLYQAQYDKVRINSMTLKIIPKANVLSQLEAQQDGLVNVTGDGAVHTCIDRDGKVPTNIARVTRYPSYRKYSVLKTFTRTYAVKYPTGVWLDCQNIFEDTTLLNRLGLNGSICIYAESLLEDNAELFNEPWATFELSFNCVFQGKTSASIGIDNNGVITITPDSASPTYAPQTYQVLRGSISGDKRVDMSGNLVVVDDNDLP